ncbi:MAG: DUF455 domain-containing protein, partial [Planctomicrobium sp.]|nr:DUF455 domain-containing protein [Planctomicrobium sp.]
MSKERDRMELREFAEQVLLQGDLKTKLTVSPEPMSDDSPGDALRVKEPTRSDELVFAPRRSAPKMPSDQSLLDPAKRAVAHHILAN